MCVGLQTSVFVNVLVRVIRSEGVCNSVRKCLCEYLL